MTINGINLQEHDFLNFAYFWTAKRPRMTMIFSQEEGGGGGLPYEGLRERKERTNRHVE